MMALVGPLVSLALGGLFFLVHAVAERASFNLRFAFFYLGSLNVFLGVFNLLPAFPMDGGRILRALLTDRMGAVRATNVASRVGKVFAILFGAWGLLSFNMFLVLIAFFVFMGAEAETRSVMVRALLGRLHVGDMMQRGILMLPADVSVDTAAERMLRERTMAYAVMEGAQLIGVVTLDDVQKVPVDQRGGVPVRAIVTQVQPVSPSDDATTALRLMTERDLPVLAVVEGGLVVGTVSRDDIGRTLKLSELEATQQANHHRVPRPVMP
jgi:CBS domain-containing protein